MVSVKNSSIHQVASSDGFYAIDATRNSEKNIFTFVDFFAVLGSGVEMENGRGSCESAFAEAWVALAPGGMTNPDGVTGGSSVWAANFSTMAWMSSGLSSSY